MGVRLPSGLSLADTDDMRVRDAMCALWRDTFHDTDTYIRRVLTRWADPCLSMAAVDSGHTPAAMLCAHKFEFTGGLRGLYLHGLATRPDCRRKGIMARMLELCAERARDENIDFLFLIPADEHLRKYYAGLSYLDIAPRYFAYLPFPMMECGDASWSAFREFEKRQPAASIIHSNEDLKTVAEEWAESGGELSGCPGFLLRKGKCIALADDRYLATALKSTEESVKTYLAPTQKDNLEAIVDVRLEPYAMIYPLVRRIPVEIYVNFLMD